MSDDAKTCFIIQPLTTPKAFVERYNDDPDHFIHVLECLHIPAVDKAGFKPIKPIAQGTDLIQAEIIANLETADLVLCDISCLNPNVFFEMGVRTALNKPICFVMDEHTGKIPFDTGMLNHKAYKSTMRVWELDAQIQVISDHIKASYVRSEEQNTLWRRLGIKTSARAYEIKEGTEGKLDEILFQIEALRETPYIPINSLLVSGEEFSTGWTKNELLQVIDELEKIIPDEVQIKDFKFRESGGRIEFTGPIPSHTRVVVRKIMDDHGLKGNFIGGHLHIRT